MCVFIIKDVRLIHLFSIVFAKPCSSVQIDKIYIALDAQKIPVREICLLKDTVLMLGLLVLLGKGEY